jgi:biopolymer transport protein ExbD
MKIKRSFKSTNEINMASTSDIAFLLIIFFIVTSSFIFKDGLPLVLPSKNKQAKEVKKEEITTVEVRPNDLITVDNIRTTPAELEKKLTDLIRKDDESVVLLKIEKSVMYQKAIDMIDIVKYAGVRKLSLRMM